MIIRLVGDGSGLFPVLHLIHFAIAAFAFAGVFRLSEIALGRRLAVAVTFSALVFPLVLTQIGFMYLEIAMMAAFVHALLAWHGGNVVKAAVWATLAVLVKGSGIIIAVALAGAALFDPRPDRRSVKNALSVAIIPLLTVLGQASAGSLEGTADIRGHVIIMVEYLASVPDLALVLLVFLVTSIVAPPWRMGDERDSNRAIDVQITNIFVLVSFVAFFLAIPFLGLRNPVLPRYYVVILPLALIGVAAIAKRYFSHRVPH